MEKITLVVRRKWNRKALLLPCLCVAVYLISVLLLYEFGPVDWPTHKPVLFYTLQFLYIVFFVWGYYAGFKSKLPHARQWSKKQTRKLLRSLPFWVVLSIIFNFIKMIRSYGIKSLDFLSILKRFISGLLDAGASYREVGRLSKILVSNDVYGGKLFTLSNFLWAFFDMNIIFLAILYFPSGNKRQKILTAVLFLEIVIYYMSIGTSIGVFRLLLSIFVFVFIASQSLCGGIAAHFKVQKNSGKKALICGVLLLSAFIAYFVVMLKSRGGILNWDKSGFSIGGVSLDYDSIMFKILPTFLFIPLISVASYVTQGLYGFSLSLELPWIPMFGLGGSMWVVNLLARHGVNIGQFTYQSRIMERFNWDDRVQWASMYTWAANDLSLYGVILWMFLIGYVFALVYRDSVTTKNPFAKLLVVYFALMCIFMPGNNQVFQIVDTHFAFITAFIAWLVTTRVRVRI